MKQKSLVNYALEESELILQKLLRIKSPVVKTNTETKNTETTEAYSKDLFDKFILSLKKIFCKSNSYILEEFDTILAVSNYTIERQSYWIYGGMKDGEAILPFIERDSMQRYRAITANKLCLVTNQTFKDMVSTIKTALPNKSPYEVLLEENRSYLIVGSKGLFLLDSFKREPYLLKYDKLKFEFTTSILSIFGELAHTYSQIFNKKIIVLGGSFLWEYFYYPRNLFLSVCSDNLIEDLDSYLYMDSRFSYFNRYAYIEIKTNRTDTWNYTHYKRS